MEDEGLKSDEDIVGTMTFEKGDNFSNVKEESNPHHKQESPSKLSNIGDGGLYNERGRKELREHEQKLEDAFERELYSSKGHHTLGLNREEPMNHDHDGDRKMVDEDTTFNVNLGQLNSTEVIRKDNLHSEEKLFSDMYGEEDSRSYFEGSRRFQHERELDSNNVETVKTLNEIREESSGGKKSKSGTEGRTIQKTQHRQRKSIPLEFITDARFFIYALFFDLSLIFR